MLRRLASMRWWLGAAFALVAALTAFAVVRVLSVRSQDAFRRYGQDFAVGSAVSASEQLKDAVSLEQLRAMTLDLAATSRAAFFVFDARGQARTPLVSNGSAWRAVPLHAGALRAALDNRRFIHVSPDGSSIVVGLRIRGGSGGELVSYFLRPELSTQLGVIRSEFPSAALLAAVLGGLAGLAIATVIALRLGRMARSAEAIELGDFSLSVAGSFPDEVGMLGRALDAMRLRLGSLVTVLEADRLRLERLLNRLSDGVLVVDRDERVLFANEAAQLLLRTSRLEGAPVPEHWDGLSLRGFARRVLASAAPLEEELLCADRRFVAVSGIPPRDGGEEAIIILADRTERERTERAQRDFATNASHQLRTPLASITAAIEMLEDGAKDDPVVREEFLAYIGEETRRLSRLTRALLVLARAEAGQEAPRLTSIPLRPVLQHVQSSFKSPAVPLTVDCDPQTTAIADADLLEQALFNLTANALAHTSTGSIVLRAAPADDGAVVVAVEDTGSGMPAAVRRRAFDRFYRGSDESSDGFGLGLAIAKQVVELLGSEIELSSRPGVGTTARIVLQSRVVEPVA